MDAGTHVTRPPPTSAWSAVRVARCRFDLRSGKPGLCLRARARSSSGSGAAVIAGRHRLTGCPRRTGLFEGHDR